MERAEQFGDVQVAPRRRRVKRHPRARARRIIIAAGKRRSVSRNCLRERRVRRLRVAIDRQRILADDPPLLRRDRVGGDERRQPRRIVRGVTSR